MSNKNHYKEYLVHYYLHDEHGIHPCAERVFADNPVAARKFILDSSAIAKDFIAIRFVHFDLLRA